VTLGSVLDDVSALGFAVSPFTLICAKEDRSWGRRLGLAAALYGNRSQSPLSVV
jgi:hypothetical protein